MKKSDPIIVQNFLKVNGQFCTTFKKSLHFLQYFPYLCRQKSQNPFTYARLLRYIFSKTPKTPKTAVSVGENGGFWRFYTFLFGDRLSICCKISMSSLFSMKTVSFFPFTLRESILIMDMWNCIENPVCGWKWGG
ncbi:MAG: hypothetical protein LBK75_08360 [Oscillospiraceae bacterium]|nr:hypothetical protein [Oscillospiraceae bacterium]